jgi:hypothetical protein
VIGGGKKLNLGTAGRWDLNRCRNRRSNGGQTSEQRVLLDLGDQAVVTGAFRILMQQMVKFGRHREGERANPQQEHQTSDRQPASRARML